MAARPISQSLSQVANARANKIIAPQLAQQTSYGEHQNAVIRAFANSLLGRLQPIAGQVGADYDAAIKQVGSLSGQAAQYLSGQNPVAQQQQLGSAVGAPASQQAQAAQGLSDTFTGGAGVLAFTGGTIPGSQLAANKAAAMSQARALPAIGALAGQQSLSSALYTQSQSRDKILAQRPGLVQQEENVIQRNNLSRAATKQRADAAQAKLDARAHQIDPGASKVTGTVMYYDGTQAKDAKGNPIPVASAAGKGFHYPDAYGREVMYNPDGSQTILSEGQYTDSAGTTRRVGLNGQQTVISTKPAKAATPHYTTVSDGTGTYVVNEDTGERRKVAGPKISSPSTSAPTTKKINGVTFQWDAARKGWVKSGLPKETPKPAKPESLSRPDRLKYQGLALTLADQSFNGAPETKPGAGDALPAITYKEALFEGQKEGIPMEILIPALKRVYGTKAVAKLSAAVKGLGNLKLG